MTHLFDANAWLRSIERPEELTSLASSLILTLGTAPFGLSAISIYEVGQKARKGKLALSLPIDRWLAMALRSSFVRVLPIDAEIAQRSE
jgi:PIN domain nuclease of toxin-antitoxin system